MIARRGAAISSAWLQLDREWARGFVEAGAGRDDCW